MHYKTKRTAKIKSTTTFYLPREILNKLDFIANLENQSRSRIVEVCVRFYQKGESDGGDEFKLVKKRFYKKPKRAKRRSVKKKIHLAKGNGQSLFKDL